MKPQLKRIDTNSASSLDELCARSPRSFGFWVNASIGSEETEGSDDFEVFVCNREWQEDESRPTWQLAEKFLLVDGGCDSAKVMDSLNAYLAECSGGSWTEVVEKISRIGTWGSRGISRRSSVSDSLCLDC